MSKFLISKKVSEYLNVDQKDFSNLMKQKGFSERLSIPVVVSWEGNPPSEIVNLLGKKKAYELAEEFNNSDHSNYNYLMDVLTDDEKQIVNDMAREEGVEKATEIADFFAMMHEPMTLDSSRSVAKVMIEESIEDASEASITINGSLRSGEKVNRTFLVTISSQREEVIYENARDLFILEQKDEIDTANIIVRVFNPHETGIIKDKDGNEIEISRYKSNISGYFYNKGKFFGLSSGQIENIFASDYGLDSLTNTNDRISFIGSGTITREATEEETIPGMFNRFSVSKRR